MAYGDIGSVIDTLEWNTADISFPVIAHVAGNVYVIACRVADTTGWLYTVEIDGAGNIGAAVIDSAQFEAVVANGVDLIHIGDTIFAMLTRVSYTNLKLITISIAADGTIGAVIDTETIGAPNSDYASICSVSGNIFAIAYSEAGTGDGFVSTVNIDGDGNIGPVIDSLEFDATAGDYCVIVNVSETVCAIAYAQSGSTKLVCTVSIDGAGNIGGAVIDSITVTTLSTWTPVGFCRAQNDAFIVVFQDTDHDGWAASITIDPAGNIGAAVVDTLEYEPVEMHAPHVVGFGLGYCAVVHGGSLNHGYIKTFKVEENGDIGDAVIDSAEFEGTYCGTPHILGTTGDIYAIVYRGTDSDGFIKTIGIDTPPVERVQHLIIMGVG